MSEHEKQQMRQAVKSLMAKALVKVIAPEPKRLGGRPLKPLTGDHRRDLARLRTRLCMRRKRGMVNA